MKIAKYFDQEEFLDDFKTDLRKEVIEALGIIKNRGQRRIIEGMINQIFNKYYKRLFPSCKFCNGTGHVAVNSKDYSCMNCDAKGYLSG